MSKIKPNELCPCQSGKKYKKCCGNLSHKALDIEDHRNHALEGTWGLSGTEIRMSIIRKSSDPTNPMNSAIPGGGSGEYKVCFILSKPNYSTLGETNIDFDDSKIGDSHIFIGSPDEFRAEFSANLEDGCYQFFGYPNERGFLGRIDVEKIVAINALAAELKAYDVIAPTLSRLSLLTDVPINISQTIITEISTKNFTTSFSLPYVGKATPEFSNYKLDETTSKFASLYREALNSNSSHYQFLCFYKIIEGIRKIRKERVTLENKEALSKGLTPPSRVSDKIPDDREGQISWLNFLFGSSAWSDMALSQVFRNDAAGKKINDLIRENGALDRVRNKIAHTVIRDESQTTYNFDLGMDTSEVHTWLPLCKCLTIYLLKKEYPALFGIES